MAKAKPKAVAAVDVVAPEQSAPVVDLAAQGHTIIKLENDVQMAFSIQHPRDNKAVLKEALEALELSDTLAQTAIYKKPVGRAKNEQTGRYDGEMRYAEGLSIRAAEELRRIYGNNSAGTAIISETVDAAKIGAVFLDYEKNNRFAEEQTVSKFYRDSHTGHLKQIPPDRFNDVVIKAAKSKLLREVVLRSLPAWLKAEFQEKAYALMAAGDIRTQRNRMIKAFAELKVTPEMIENLIGRPAEKATRDNIVTLKGVWSAIRDGEQTVEEAFGIKKPESAKAEPAMKPKGGLFEDREPDGRTQVQNPGQEG